MVDWTGQSGPVVEALRAIVLSCRRSLTDDNSSHPRLHVHHHNYLLPKQAPSRYAPACRTPLSKCSPPRGPCIITRTRPARRCSRRRSRRGPSSTRKERRSSSRVQVQASSDDVVVLQGMNT